MESSRQRVLDATIELTRELGETPSLRTIGERAGVALGTISAHFPSRDDLLVEVERRELERLDEQLGDATDVDPTRPFAHSAPSDEPTRGSRACCSTTTARTCCRRNVSAA